MGYVHPDADVRGRRPRRQRVARELDRRRAVRSLIAVAVAAFAATEEAAAFDGEHARLLTFIQREHPTGRPSARRGCSCRGAGATARLIEIGVRFNENIAEVDDELVVTEDELDGLPDDYRQGLGRTDDGRYPC